MPGSYFRTMKIPTLKASQLWYQPKLAKITKSSPMCVVKNRKRRERKNGLTYL